jgi:hypothetical protein
MPEIDKEIGERKDRRERTHKTEENERYEKRREEKIPSFALDSVKAKIQDKRKRVRFGLARSREIGREKEIERKIKRKSRRCSS